MTGTRTARRTGTSGVTDVAGLPVETAAAMPVSAVATALGSDLRSGLTAREAAGRLAQAGPNAVRDHSANALKVLLRQVKSPLLALLLATAFASFILGQRTDAVVIATILAASVGLGFANEYRAERATEALHSGVRHTVTVIRDGVPAPADVVDLVPGDLVRLSLGTVVPAEMRITETDGLECDESILTGESLPTAKSAGPVTPGTPQGDLASIAFMGTVVHAGAGAGLVIATGVHTEFGRVAADLGGVHPETDFQAGLRRFSFLLLKVAVALTTLILVVNILLSRPLIDSLLFSLAIAVGITPQLLPAVVSAALATGSRQLARRKVLVKRLVSIEDLGDIDILVTDKTGTLTEGRITFTRAVGPAGDDDDRPRELGLLATDPGLGNALDLALRAAGAEPRGYTRLASAPFDHERRMSTVLVDTPEGDRVLVTKGAPETVIDACHDVPAEARTTLDALLSAGSRVIAVATRPAPGAATVSASDERGLSLVGFLIFLDPPKHGVASSLRRLAGLGIRVVVATGDHPLVARKLCADLGLPAGRTVAGPELDLLDDDHLWAAAQEGGIFARVSPEQKARLVRVLRRDGRAVGFLGDGVNDALALHDADVGISVDTAADIAKDAADIVLLEKSLDVLADGVAEGRRIFANTVKYVLMGTAGNFGNMFSVAGASAVLAFLPLLPSQILLGNLLYDTSQLTIPADHVDPEQLAAPAHWDIGLIRRFMLVFGLISSLFDFLTFGVLLGPLHAGAGLFRTGWFVESLATQTLIIFAVRTRRVPFLRSRPSRPLVLSVVAVVAVGVALPLAPMSRALGFVTPPAALYPAVAALVVAYLAAVEYAKKRFFAEPHPYEAGRRRDASHQVNRRVAPFSSNKPVARGFHRAPG
ncbi:magnesium-translocating P-type ATPase [Planotetraspora thailandica]|uniref:Magnesium-transporting ATPase, P-type 1 n=1 Tax=Planotetraspora thailandica TaxID=487172 RepID=A0A8J3V463_9ACTN|nr:magnesium-translocating P-type ATPase [Planotetraspora thailandica]GII56516.1 magnesium-translocating P-type ATPase [Planotetraspora thailandica]